MVGNSLASFTSSWMWEFTGVCFGTRVDIMSNSVFIRDGNLRVSTSTATGGSILASQYIRSGEKLWEFPDKIIYNFGTQLRKEAEFV